MRSWWYADIRHWITEALHYLASESPCHADMNMTVLLHGIDLWPVIGWKNAFSVDNCPYMTAGACSQPPSFSWWTILWWTLSITCPLPPPILMVRLSPIPIINRAEINLNTPKPWRYALSTGPIPEWSECQKNKEGDDKQCQMLANSIPEKSTEDEQPPHYSGDN